MAVGVNPSAGPARCGAVALRGATVRYGARLIGLMFPLARAILSEGAGKIPLNKPKTIEENANIDVKDFKGPLPKILVI